MNIDNGKRPSTPTGPGRREVGRELPPLRGSRDEWRDTFASSDNFRDEEQNQECLQLIEIVFGLALDRC